MRVGQVGQGTVTVVNVEEAACAAAYNHLLTEDAGLARDTHENLLMAQRQLDIAVGDRPLCSVLRPRFITQERADDLARISGIFAGLMERLGEHLLASDALLDLVGASEQEREVWSIDPGYPGFTLTSRLDSFMMGGHPWFIEYNAESPAGIAFCDILSDLFQHLPAMRRWNRSGSLGRYEVRTRLLETILWAYHAWGGSGLPSMAVVDWEHVVTRRDFELCTDFFRAHGIPSMIVDPRKLEYRRGALWNGDQRITLVYRRVLLHELLDKADEARDLLQAYRDGAVCLVNSPRSKLLHKKAVLALLADGTVDLHLNRLEQQVVKRTIPWTRLMRPGPTTYHDRTVDLARFVIAEQERMALKPGDDYGGRGVVLGWECSRDEWERAVEAAMDRLYVVQERVPVPQGEFPVWEDGHLAIEPLLVDTNPLLFRSEMGGILTRMSSNPLLNVSAGTGSSAPTFVVPEEGD
jgi:hypothetical protein